MRQDVGLQRKLVDAAHKAMAFDTAPVSFVEPTEEPSLEEFIEDFEDVLDA